MFTCVNVRIKEKVSNGFLPVNLVYLEAGTPGKQIEGIFLHVPSFTGPDHEVEFGFISGPVIKVD